MTARNSIEALERARETCKACAYGERPDAIITLLARLSERVAMGTVQDDEVAAIMVLVRG